MSAVTGTTVPMRECSIAISTTIPATRTTTMVPVPFDFGTSRPANILKGKSRIVLKGGNSS
jgi:hypothetical protein